MVKIPIDVNIEALKDSVKHEIRRELKIKEGAENLLQVAKGRKLKSQAEHIVKESRNKIEFLRLKLQDVIAQVPDDEGEGSNISTGLAQYALLQFVVIVYLKLLL